MRSARLVPLLILVLALGACSSDDGGSAPSSSSSTSSSAQVGTPTATGTASAVTTAKPIATYTVPIPGRSGDTLDVGLISLVVSGDVTTLTVSYTPHLTDGSSTALSVIQLRGGAELAGDPVLLDLKNLKRYALLHAQGAELDRWGSDVNATRAGDGQTAIGVYHYAAPQDPVTTMDVQVNPSWPTFENVALTR